MAAVKSLKSGGRCPAFFFKIDFRQQILKRAIKLSKIRAFSEEGGRGEREARASIHHETRKRSKLTVWVRTSRGIVLIEKKEKLS